MGKGQCSSEQLKVRLHSIWREDDIYVQMKPRLHVNETYEEFIGKEP